MAVHLLFLFKNRQQYADQPLNFRYRPSYHGSSFIFLFIFCLRLALCFII